MNQRTLRRAKLQQVKPKRNRAKKWNFQFALKTYKDGKHIANIGRIDDKHRRKFIGDLPVNVFDAPINLREIIYMYCNHAEALGFNRTKIILDEEFAYLTMLLHYEQEVILAPQLKSINLLQDVDFKVTNTKTSLKIQEYLKELVLYGDAKENKIGDYRAYYASKKKDVKKLIIKWWIELEGIDGIDFEERLKLIQSGRFKSKIIKQER